VGVHCLLRAGGVGFKLDLIWVWFGFIWFGLV
jgi:hypothetical protein